MVGKEVVELKEVVKGIKHHYKSDSSAISSLRKYIGTNVIPEYRLLQIENKWYVDRM
jgi:hypothetical protein